jgi:hypothetical protein
MRLQYYDLLGYEILLFCKNNKQQKSFHYKENDYRNLGEYDFSIAFHSKAKLVNKLYELVFSNEKITIKDNVELAKSRILIKDVLLRSINSFDELLYLAETSKEKYTVVKVRCNWSLLRSQIIKHNILTPNADISFSYLSLIVSNVVKVTQTLLSSIPLILTRKKKKKIPDNYSKKENRVVFFPHKGVAYGNSFEKDYYYDNKLSSPLNKSNILHLEYSGFNNSIAEDYINQDLKYRFIEKPTPLDALKYLINNLKSIPINVAKHNKHKHLSLMSTLLFAYIDTLASFLSEFYVQKMSSIVGCKFALIGYDVLLPKEISVALHRLGIETIAIQERYTLPYAGNYNLVIDNYLVWSYNVEAMINDSIGESYVGNYIVTGPPRSDKVNLDKRNTIPGFRKKIIVYSNSPEPKNADKYTLLNSWLNIKTLLQDVLELSVKFPECDFKIRAKHTGWSNIAFFGPILESLSCNDNVEIIDDYQKMDISYKLLSNAYGVIGHHTSISDEAMCHGIPVLFHDFSPYASSVYKKNYDYNGLELFSSSSEEFQLKFFNYFIKEQYPDEIKSYMCENYKNLCNGNVTTRVNNILHEIIQLDIN